MPLVPLRLVVAKTSVMRPQHIPVQARCGEQAFVGIFDDNANTDLTVTIGGAAATQIGTYKHLARKRATPPFRSVNS
jgi:hypothetical protein